MSRPQAELWGGGQHLKQAGGYPLVIIYYKYTFNRILTSKHNFPISFHPKVPLSALIEFS